MSKRFLPTEHWQLVPKLRLGTQVREALLLEAAAKQSFAIVRSQAELGTESWGPRRAAMSRDAWTSLEDDQLLRQCDVDTYRASGPGGQKRNKTSSAVRLRHLPSGLIVIAEESRSQHENKAKALRRLRQALYLKLRRPRPEDKTDKPAAPREIAAAKNAAGRLDVGRKDARFWPAAGCVLDAMDAAQARVHDAAVALGVTTGNLLAFLQIEGKVWEHANILRQRHGQKPLRAGD
jgi:RF-1 domain